jgi:hypothetical protein
MTGLTSTLMVLMLNLNDSHILFAIGREAEDFTFPTVRVRKKTLRFYAFTDIFADFMPPLQVIAVIVVDENDLENYFCCRNV